MINFKSDLFIKLINKGMNEDLLSSAIHVPFLDLAATFRIILDESITGRPNEIGTVPVSQVMMEQEGLTEEDLFALALESTRNRYSFEVKPLVQKMKEIILKEMPDISVDALGFLLGGGPMSNLYCATNSEGILGANIMLFPDALKLFADSIGKNEIYILPCSIHEVILVPDLDGLEIEQLKELVKEVNTNEVPVEDILSDNVYLFNALTEQVTIL